MNTLIIYDSKFGNTEKIALQIAETLRAYGSAKAVRAANINGTTLTNVDLLIVGGPTQAWQATSAVKELFGHLKANDVDRLFTADFDTRFDKPRWMTGSAAGAIAKQLKRLGAISLLPPESFFVQKTEGPLVEGELEHAARWAESLHEEYERQAKLSKVIA